MVEWRDPYSVFPLSKDKRNCYAKNTQGRLAHTCRSRDSVGTEMHKVPSVSSKNSVS